MCCGRIFEPRPAVRVLILMEITESVKNITSTAIFSASAKNLRWFGGRNHVLWVTNSGPQQGLLAAYHRRHANRTRLNLQSNAEGVA